MSLLTLLAAPPPFVPDPELEVLLAEFNAIKTAALTAEEIDLLERYYVWQVGAEPRENVKAIAKDLQKPQPSIRKGARLAAEKLKVAAAEWYGRYVQWMDDWNGKV